MEIRFEGDGSVKEAVGSRVEEGEKFRVRR